MAAISLPEELKKKMADVFNAALKNAIELDAALVRIREEQERMNAFDEFYSLVSTICSPIDNRDPIVRYVCALVAELAYHHVTKFEIDDKCSKRAKVIPCEEYQKIIAGGVPANVGNYLQGLESIKYFVVVDPGIVAVGIAFNGMLFIGFRGTQFLFDWRINIRSKLLQVNQRFRYHSPYASNYINARLHKGFAEEALRISYRILDAIHDNNLGNINHVFLTGHSLGGAVAAIAENFIHIAPTSVITFGAPRYCDYFTSFLSSNGPPTQIQRQGDIVPLVPPRFLGYSDQPYVFHTNGEYFNELQNRRSFLGQLWMWARFILKYFEPHSMEKYRNELGQTAGASGASSPLTPYDKIKINE